LVLGIDIGGTKETVALADGQGRILHQVRRRTEREKGAQGVLTAVLEMVREVLVQTGTAREGIGRVGIGFGGPIDAHHGVVIRSHHVPGWEGVPLRAFLEERLGVPVIVDNDANAGTLGEARFGAGRGVRDLLYVNIGTGIGGGILANGSLVRGVTTTAGEIGHVVVQENGPRCTCGRRGCLEALCSGDSIARRAREAMAARPTEGRSLRQIAGDGPTLTSEHVFAAARQGDALAQEILQDTIRYLALAIGNAVTLLNPALVIVGGGVSEAGDLLFEPLRAAVAEVALDVPGRAVRIVPAALGYEAGVVGAVALALEEGHAEAKGN